MGGNVIFKRQLARLKLGKHVSDIEHCKELANASYYTEAFLAMWILVEVTSKNIQITYRVSMAADNISDSLFKSLLKNKIDTEKYNLRRQIIDTTFLQVKKMYGTRREYVNAKDVISALKLIATDADEGKLKFLLASEVDEAPTGFSSKTTIREKRNDLVHNNRTISKDDFKKYEDYFDYFFSLTVMAKLANDAE